MALPALTPINFQTNSKKTFTTTALEPRKLLRFALPAGTNRLTVKVTSTAIAHPRFVFYNADGTINNIGTTNDSASNSTAWTYSNANLAPNGGEGYIYIGSDTSFGAMLVQVEAATPTNATPTITDLDAPAPTPTPTPTPSAYTAVAAAVTKKLGEHREPSVGTAFDSVIYLGEVNVYTVTTQETGRITAAVGGIGTAKVTATLYTVAGTIASLVTTDQVPAGTYYMAVSTTQTSQLPLTITIRFASATEIAAQEAEKAVMTTLKTKAKSGSALVDNDVLSIVLGSSITATTAIGILDIGGGYLELRQAGLSDSEATSALAIYNLKLEPAKYESEQAIEYINADVNRLPLFYAYLTGQNISRPELTPLFATFRANVQVFNALRAWHASLV